MDNDGYPTEEDFNIIAQLESDDDFPTLTELFNSCGSGRAYITEGIDWYKKPCPVLTLHTGGWSGCEDMIIHLENNEEFWERCWMSTERGGHYVFRRL